MSLKQQRNTRQRQLVLDVVRGRRDHPTAEQIYQSVREQDAHVSRGPIIKFFAPLLTIFMNLPSFLIILFFFI